MTKKKKTLLWVVISLITVLAIAGTVTAIVLPVTYYIDPAWISQNPDYDVEVTDIGGYTTLVKKDTSSFKVIGFTDMHLDTHQDKGDLTMEYMIRNIVNEKPDLVVFVGDNITSAINRRRAKQLCSTMEDLGVYWTLVLGNHEGDNPWSMSRKQMIKLFSSYPHCLVECDEKKIVMGETVWGYGNHVLNLADETGFIYQSLYFLDGGAEMSEEDMIAYDAEFEDKSHNDYDYIKESQIEWYEETVMDIEILNGSPVKSVIFDHIALPEYKIAYNEITGETEATGMTPNCYGAPNENGTCLLFGLRYETICHSGHNSCLFDAIKLMGSTQAVICGHDHINDFGVMYQDVLLAYNEPSGYSSYNLVSKGLSDQLMQGYSIYMFSTDGSMEMTQMHNCDVYPDEQDDILPLYWPER